MEPLLASYRPGVCVTTAAPGLPFNSVSLLVILIVFFILIGLVGAGAAGYANSGDYGYVCVKRRLDRPVDLPDVHHLALRRGLLSVKFAFISLAVILEGLGPVDALKRSWNLSKGSFWRILGRMIIIGLVVGVIGMILGAIIGQFWELARRCLPP